MWICCLRKKEGDEKRTGLFFFLLRGERGRMRKEGRWRGRDVIIIMFRPSVR